MKLCFHWCKGSFSCSVRPTCPGIVLLLSYYGISWTSSSPSYPYCFQSLPVLPWWQWYTCGEYQLGNIMMWWGVTHCLVYWLHSYWGHNWLVNSSRSHVAKTAHFAGRRTGNHRPIESDRDLEWWAGQFTYSSLVGVVDPRHCTCLFF